MYIIDFGGSIRIHGKSINGDIHYSLYRLGKKLYRRAKGKRRKKKNHEKYKIAHDENKKTSCIMRRNVKLGMGKVFRFGIAGRSEKLHSFFRRSSHKSHPHTLIHSYTFLQFLLCSLLLALILISSAEIYRQFVCRD